MRINVGSKKIIKSVLLGILAGVVVSCGVLGGVTQAGDVPEVLASLARNEEITARETMAVWPAVKESPPAMAQQFAAAAGQGESSAVKQAGAGSVVSPNAVYDTAMNVIPPADLSRYQGESVYIELPAAALPADSAVRIKVEWAHLPGDCREEAVSAVQATLINLEDNAVVGYGLENGVLDKILVCEVGVESAQEHPWNIID